MGSVPTCDFTRNDLSQTLALARQLNSLDFTATQAIQRGQLLPVIRDRSGSTSDLPPIRPVGATRLAQ